MIIYYLMPLPPFLSSFLLMQLLCVHALLLGLSALSCKKAKQNNNKRTKNCYWNQKINALILRNKLAAFCACESEYIIAYKLAVWCIVKCSKTVGMQAVHRDISSLDVGQNIQVIRGGGGLLLVTALHLLWRYWPVSPQPQLWRMSTEASSQEVSISAGWVCLLLSETRASDSRLHRK